MNAPRFSLIAFDMDGVLLDTTAGHARAYRALWSRLGIEGPPYELLAGRSTREAVAEVTASLHPGAAELDEWVRFKQSRAREHLASESLLYGDTRSTLEAIGRTALRMGLGTSASRAGAQPLLTRFGLEGFFDSILTADEIDRGKPAPDVYEALIERIGARPEETLVVEDSAPGIQAGLAAGAFAVSVRSGQRVEDERFLAAFPDLRAIVPFLGGTRS